MSTSSSNAKLVANRSLLSYWRNAAEFFRGSGHMLRRCSKTHFRLGIFNFILGPRSAWPIVWYVILDDVLGLFMFHAFSCSSPQFRRHSHFAQFRSEDWDPNAANCTRCQNCTNCWKRLVASWCFVTIFMFASRWSQKSKKIVVMFPMILIPDHSSIFFSFEW